MASRANILVVDDDLNVLRMLALTLFVEGFQVSTADSGNDAMRLIAESEFDILVVDLRMPGVNCFDIIEGFRDRSEGAPVIVTTKYPDDESMRLCSIAKASVMQKPYNVHALASNIRQALAHKAVASSP
ncbi:MAG: response regulator [Bradymonadales bacterium]